ncbi:MAG: PD-(D/E)XK nuclease family protein [Desulfovibrio sp.]|jgi:hypothetical protein|nr:PD-(D/E)XK nuclease family protein [Desulfovibrio sp.]
MITHLSVSQLGMYQRCGEQYRRRYIEGESIPPGIAARIGTGVHKAVELNSRVKKKTGHDLPLDEIKDAAVDGYHEALMEGVYLAPESLPAAREAMAKGRDTAVALAGLYRETLAPLIMPELIEEKITLTLPGVALPIVTILDCYTQDWVLRDLKTSGRKWSAERADTSPQPTLYREAVKLASGQYPEAMVFDVLVSTKTPQVQTLATQRTTEDLEILGKQFAGMLQSVEAGNFPAAQPGSWVCSSTWCGYWWSCPYIPEHRKTLPKKTA